MATSYLLSPSVHWCTVNDRCIILDLANDRYLRASAADFEALLPFVEPNCRFPREIPPHLSPAAEELQAAGVLVRIPHAPSRGHCESLTRPRKMVSRDEHPVAHGKALSVLPHFVAACITADIWLRRTSLSRISARVSQRKHRLPASNSTVNIDTAIRLVELYNFLRPFYPRNYVCLFDCLALIEFLAKWRIFPDWVFGVTVDPFQAHCWVQHGDVVLCDTLSFSARWYSPIMVI